MAAAKYPSDIIDTRGNIRIIDTRDTTDTFHPRAFSTGFKRSCVTIGLGIARCPRTPSTSPSPSSPFSSRSSFAPSAPDLRLQAAAIIAIHDAIRIISIILIYIYAGVTPPASSPEICALPVHTLAVLLQLRSLPAFLPCLVLLSPPKSSASACTPPRYPPTKHALMAVATMPFNLDVLELFRLAHHLWAGTEIESALRGLRRRRQQRRRECGRQRKQHGGRPR